MEDTITITKQEYYELRLAQEKLWLLERGGVDNWDGYGESLYPDDEETLADIREELAKEILDN